MNQRILSDDAFRSCTHTDNHIMLRGKNRDIHYVHIPTRELEQHKSNINILPQL